MNQVVVIIDPKFAISDDPHAESHADVETFEIHDGALFIYYKGNDIPYIYAPGIWRRVMETEL